MRSFIIACSIFLLTPFQPAQAHPHVWTDMTIELLFNDDGMVTGLHQTWLFDEYYTAYAIEGMDVDGDGKPDPEKLNEIMQVNLGHLNEYGYFTEAREKDEVLKLKPITDASTRMLENRLEMSFTTPFEKPVSSKGSNFIYAIFDPTYYVEMLHAETENPVILSGAPAGCSYKIIPPNPDPSAVAKAAMLYASAQGGMGLGSFFAERVRLTCPED